MFRFLLGVVAGLALAFVGVIAVEMFSAVVHPFPEDFPKADEGEAFQQAICRHVENYPSWVLAVAAGMWLEIIYLGALAGAWISGRAAGVTVAGLLLLALAFNLWMLPYPVWFELAMLLGLPIMTWLAVRSPRRLAQPPTDAPPKSTSTAAG